jgi:hypothetical protein
VVIVHKESDHHFVDVSAHGWSAYSPQVLPVLHEAALPDAPSEKLPPPEILDAKVETFFFTAVDWHFGQVTSVLLLKRTNSSKDFPHSLQTNSNKGIG